MLPKKNRLTLKADFQTVLKQGKIQHAKYYAFSYIITEKPEKRVGMIVSNKISKKAVERNKIKRAARAAAQEVLENLPSGILGVFLAKPQANLQTHGVLNKDAREVLKKAS